MLTYRGFPRGDYLPRFPGSARAFTASQAGLSGLHVTPKPLIRAENSSSSSKTHYSQVNTYRETSKFKLPTRNNSQLATSNYRSVTGSAVLVSKCVVSYKEFWYNQLRHLREWVLKLGSSVLRLGSKLKELFSGGARVPVVLLTSILVFLCALSGWNYYDVRYFIEWYTRYFQRGLLLDIYADQDPTFKAAYPPLAVIVFTSMYHVASVLTNNEVLVVFITKLPLLVSFYLMYFILIKKYNDLLGYLWLLNPLTYSIILSFQFDPIIALLLLVALYYLIEKKNYYLYGVFTTLSALIKHATALLLVVPLIILLKKREYYGLAKYVVITGVIAGAVLLPFFLKSPSGFLEKVVFFHAKRPPQQLSIWSIPYYLVEYNLDLVSPAVSHIWLYVFLAYLVIIFFVAFKESIRDEGSFALKYIILVMCGFMLFSKVINVTYYLWLTPIILVLLNEIRDKMVYKDLIKSYIFIYVWIASYGFFAFIAPLLVGEDVFMFEDWCYVPSELVYLRSQVGFFKEASMRIILYTRSRGELLSVLSALARTHHYILILIIFIHAAFQVYLIILALRHLNLARTSSALNTFISEK